jgi:hypothetical protein
VSFAGATALTGKGGIAVISTRLQLRGRFKALALERGRYGLSRLVQVGEPPVPATSSASP